MHPITTDQLHAALLAELHELLQRPVVITYAWQGAHEAPKIIAIPTILDEITNVAIHPQRNEVWASFAGRGERVISNLTTGTDASFTTLSGVDDTTNTRHAVTLATPQPGDKDLFIRIRNLADAWTGRTPPRS